MLRKLASAFILTFALTTGTYAQYVGYELEVVAVHTGDYGDGVDLNGYVTYNLNVLLTNDDDMVSAVFATPDDPPIDITFAGNLFQHESAGNTANNNACAFWAFAPSMEFDSYLTINKNSNCDVGDLFFAAIVPTTPVINGLFEGDVDGDFFDGGQLYIEDGSWFTVNNGSNGVAGADLKVKVAQFTTNESITGEFNVQIFINSDGSNVEEIQVELEALNPCEEFPLNEDVTITDDILCFGETGAIEVGVGGGVGSEGNAPVAYNLYEIAGNDTTFQYTQDADPIFNGLTQGCYLIEMIDLLGCADTTGQFCFTEPDSLILAGDLTQDILCAGDVNGQICLGVEGGVEPYNIQLDGAVVPEGCVDNLSCGEHLITVTDDNNCDADTMIVLTCPNPIEHVTSSTDVLCFNDCNGTMSTDLTGGTDSLTLTFTYQGNPFGNAITVLPDPSIDTALAALCPGIYEMLVTDTNDCTINVPFVVNEPDSLEMSIIVGDLSCNGECTGSLQVDILGGTAPFTTTCVDSQGEEIVPDALCAGDYSCTVVDFNGCSVSGDTTIVQPNAISYEIVTDSTTCFGQCDGSIFVQNLMGGSENFSYDMAEGTFVEIAPDSIGYIDLCAGLYNLLITDIDGNCTIVESDIEIGQPEELLLQAIPTEIDCFGFANGTIDISCVGGTGAINVISPDSVPCPTVLTDLEPGAYDVTIEDEYGCQTAELIEITQPDTLTIEAVNIEHLICGGICTGSFEYELAGGVEPYAVFMDDSLLTEDFDDLCAAEYELCVIDFNNCESCILVEVEEPAPVEVFVQETPVTCTGMCDGSSLVLTTGGTGPLEINYEFEGIDINSLCEGVYPLEVIDSVGCSAVDTLFIGAATITDLEVVIFTSPETCWEENDGTATAAVTGGFGDIQYQWNDPDQQTTLTAVGLEAQEQYLVVITDSLGCTITASAFIEPTEGCLFISNAVTPNGDGSNDTWTIGGLEYFPNASVQVFNRWGQVLYQSRGYSVPWDGTHNGNKVPVADYYYIIEYAASDNPVMGTVTVKY